jgi:hypothetical protein
LWALARGPVVDLSTPSGDLNDTEGCSKENQMRSGIIAAFATLLAVASVAHAQKIVVDSDGTANFAAFRSYGGPDGQVAPNPATGLMIVSAIESELRSRGLVRNDKDPDFRIVVMAAAGMDLQGVGPSWNNERYKSWGGYGNPNALMNVTTGTLLIDLVETKNKRSVWRGVAKDVFVAPPSGDLTKDAREMESLVNKTVGKMFKKYPVKPNK